MFGLLLRNFNNSYFNSSATNAFYWINIIYFEFMTEKKYKHALKIEYLPTNLC